MSIITSFKSGFLLMPVSKTRDAEMFPRSFIKKNVYITARTAITVIKKVISDFAFLEKST